MVGPRDAAEVLFFEDINKSAAWGIMRRCGGRRFYNFCSALHFWVTKVCPLLILCIFTASKVEVRLEYQQRSQPRLLEIGERLGITGPQGYPATLICPPIVSLPMIANALADMPSGVKMHRCLNVDEILRLVASELIGSEL
jgi:hypothetical protein